MYCNNSSEKEQLMSLANNQLLTLLLIEIDVNSYNRTTIATQILELLTKK